MIGRLSGKGIGAIHFHTQNAVSGKDRYFAKILLFLPMAWWSMESKDSWPESIFKKNQFGQTAHVNGTQLFFSAKPIGPRTLSNLSEPEVGVWVHLSQVPPLYQHRLPMWHPEKGPTKLAEVGWQEAGSLSLANRILYNIKACISFWSDHYCKQFKALLCLIWRIKDTKSNTLFPFYKI